ncbi:MULTISPECIES: hypothetical protein [unclassified Paenibacillus]|uniref:hypothetical protein n=1 Tax=unclassified Paenibacillus TaxID=185978 RepID=UPI00362A4DF2
MILKGFDSIEFGLYFKNYDESFEPYLLMFSEQKRNAQETSVDKEIDLNGVTVKIGRAGIRFYSYTFNDE